MFLSAMKHAGVALETQCFFCIICLLYATIRLLPQCMLGLVAEVRILHTMLFGISWQSSPDIGRNCDSNKREWMFQGIPRNERSHPDLNPDALVDHHQDPCYARSTTGNMNCSCSVVFRP